MVEVAYRRSCSSCWMFNRIFNLILYCSTVVLYCLFSWSQLLNRDLQEEFQLQLCHHKGNQKDPIFTHMRVNSTRLKKRCCVASNTLAQQEVQTQEQKLPSWEAYKRQWQIKQTTTFNIYSYLLDAVLSCGGLIANKAVSRECFVPREITLFWKQYDDPVQVCCYYDHNHEQ